MTSRTPTCLQDAIAELLEAEEAHATRLQQMREALEEVRADKTLSMYSRSVIDAALAASPEEK
jgi:uncharacterized protein (UPF0147 family)